MIASMSNGNARALVKLARGVPKRYSKAERERRRKRLAEARKKRWAKKGSATPKGTST